ncbi:hypothetical protein [Arthrobacter alpinus]|nr:hypothetical protein [Arthrobacter alpinus]
MATTAAPAAHWGILGAKFTVFAPALTVAGTALPFECAGDYMG